MPSNAETWGFVSWTGLCFMYRVGWIIRLFIPHCLSLVRATRGRRMKRQIQHKPEFLNGKHVAQTPASHLVCSWIHNREVKMSRISKFKMLICQAFLHCSTTYVNVDKPGEKIEEKVYHSGLEAEKVLMVSWKENRYQWNTKTGYRKSWRHSSRLYEWSTDEETVQYVLSHESARRG